jgi:predicted neuraminidase
METITKYPWIYLILILVISQGCSMHQKPENVPAILDQQIIFPLQNEHVHGPTIVELPNGDLLTAWFQGSGERWADDVRIMGSRLTKKNSEWSEPFLLADIPGFPDINPILFMDTKNRLWLMWYPVLANQWETSIPMYRISEDYEKPGAPVWCWQDVLFVKPGDKTEHGIQPQDRFTTAVKRQMDEYEDYLKTEIWPVLSKDQQESYSKLWSNYRTRVDSLAEGRNMIRNGRSRIGDNPEPTKLGYPLSRRIGWQTKNKAVIISDRIIVPLYSDGFGCTLFAMTDDLGQTWQFSNPVIGSIGIQATIGISKTGGLSAYLRDNGPPPKRMQVTSSSDGGYSWSIAKDTNIPNPGAGFDMATLESGEWIMIYNETESGRHDLTVAISDDEGISWKWKRKIEFDDRGEQATAYHYPAIIQGAGGLIHTVYSYHYRDRGETAHKTINYASFPVEWVKEQ